MNRAAVSVFLLVAVAFGAAACGDHEAEPTAPTFDFTPAATISVSDDGIDCQTVAVDPTCELHSGSVLMVENADRVDHRLVGTKADGRNLFDTGAMQPGDEMTLVITVDDTVTVTVADTTWPDGDSRSLAITVTPASTKD